MSRTRAANTGPSAPGGNLGEEVAILLERGAAASGVADDVGGAARLERGDIARGERTGVVHRARMDGERATALLPGGGHHIETVGVQDANRGAVGFGEDGAHHTAREERDAPALWRPGRRGVELAIRREELIGQPGHQRSVSRRPSASSAPLPRASRRIPQR